MHENNNSNFRLWLDFQQQAMFSNFFAIKLFEVIIVIKS